MTQAAQLHGAAERRAFAEFRTDEKGGKLEGYAAIFNTEARMGSFTETIDPGAFRASLTGDVLALLDHDTGKILGRTRSQTLRLSEDSKGLHFSLDLPDTQAGRDVRALAARGDLGGMSFGFTVPDRGDHWEGTKRTLRSVNLLEISIVSAFPAYPDTSLALRTMKGLQDRAWRMRQIAIAEASL